MPQATPELREEWMIGKDSDGMYEAQTYLMQAGYSLTNTWCWLTPSPEHLITEKEGRAIIFLCQEWDFDSYIRVLGPHENIIRYPIVKKEQYLTPQERLQRIESSHMILKVFPALRNRLLREFVEIEELCKK